MALNDFRRKLINKLPWTKFPLRALIFSPVNENQLAFIDVDYLRPDKEGGKDVYVFKATGEVIMTPRYGLEDKNFTICVIKTGSGAYDTLKGNLGVLTDDSKALLWEIKHDEQAKYIYASNAQLINTRFERELSPLEKIMPFAVLIIALAIAGTIILAGSTGNIAGLSEGMKALTNSLNSNTAALTHVATQASGAAAQVPPH